MDIADRVALVTGGRRIGAVVAAELAARGAHVALAYNRSREEAEDTAAAVRTKGRRALVLQADLSKAEACRALVDQAAAGLGRLDVLVNMASVYAQKAFAEIAPADLDDNLAIDLKAAFACALAAVPHMRRAGAGRIVNIADWLAASRRPRYKGYLTYYVAKTAVIGLTEALALELAEDGILVNAVAPGPILAPAGLSSEESDAVEQATPVGRWGGSVEIAKTVIALVESDFITGETVRVDGGRHLR
jgi:NAD(P)-dependent dehydrogenase (short-subunit alcohol dehydrogenase family)